MASPPEAGQRIPAAAVATPDGPFTVIASPEAVLAAGWTAAAADLLALVHPSLRAEAVAAGPALDEAVAAVAAYYDGDWGPAQAAPVRTTAPAFRRTVWSALRRVAAGQRLTYAQLAAAAGRPGAARAAGGACAHNPAALFVPCHRIVTASGRLGGFAYGTDIKASLLERERAAA